MTFPWHWQSFPYFKRFLFSKILLIFLQAHNPPNTLVMKKGGWVISGENVTKLLNKEGEDESTRTSFEQKRTGSLYRSGVFSPGTVDPDDPNNSKSCAIM